MEPSERLFWTVLLMAVFCAGQVIRDVRRRNYPMAVLATLCMLLVLSTPIGSFTARVELPRSSR